MANISIIAAVSDNYAIGKSNNLPWHLPADLKHFKALTTGHAVIMGKRTFESLINGPLPNRKNIVLTSILSEGINKGYFEAESLEEAIELCENLDNVFIMGGATVYRQSIDKVDNMFITWVHGHFQADTYFPKFDMNEWKEVSRQDFDADEKNPYPYSFCEYIRKK